MSPQLKSGAISLIVKEQWSFRENKFDMIDRNLFNRINRIDHSTMIHGSQLGHRYGKYCTSHRLSKFDREESEGTLFEIYFMYRLSLFPEDTLFPELLYRK